LHRRAHDYLSSKMTGAAIVRWQEDGAVVLAVHGAFDGASAWSLRHAMDEAPARRYVVDLTHVTEAYEFAAVILAAWWQERRRSVELTFRPGEPEHERLLAAYGLEIEETPAASAAALLGGWQPAGSGVPA
jgi:anti-anti-sigma regulatory factor